MTLTCRCVCLVIYYIININNVVGSSRLEAVHALDVSLQKSGPWDPTTEYDVGTIQRWHASRQHARMKMVEMQKLLDLKKAKAAKQIAAMRAKKRLLRAQAHQAFLDERIKADAILKEKIQPLRSNGIAAPFENSNRIDTHAHDNINDLTNKLRPAENSFHHNKVGLTDIRVSVVNRLPTDNTNITTMDVETDNKGLDDNRTSVSTSNIARTGDGGERVDSKTVPSIDSIPIHKDSLGGNNSSPVGNNVPLENTNLVEKSKISNTDPALTSIGISINNNNIQAEGTVPATNGVSVVNNQVQDVTHVQADIGGLVNSTKVLPKKTADMIDNGQVNDSGVPNSDRTSVDNIKDVEINSVSNGNELPHLGNIPIDRNGDQNVNDSINTMVQVGSDINDKRGISNDIMPSADIINGDTHSVLSEAIVPPGTLAQPMDVMLGDLELDTNRKFGSDTLDNISIVLGPQSQTLDVILHPNINKTRGNAQEHTTNKRMDNSSTTQSTVKQLTGGKNTPNNNTGNLTTFINSSNSAKVTNKTEVDTGPTLRDILSFLNVSVDIDPKLTTTSILKNDQIRTILAKAVQNISRLLSLDNANKTPHRVDVFHHVHVHKHDPHGATDFTNNVTKGGHQSDQVKSPPDFALHDLPIVDLTQPTDPFEGINPNKFPDVFSVKDHSNIVSGANGGGKVEKQSETTSIGNVKFNDIADSIGTRNSPGFGGFPETVEPHNTGGILADKPKPVDIINILSSLGELSPKGIGVNDIKRTNSDQSIKVIAPSPPPSGDVLQSTPSSGIQTLSGGVIPMPQVSNSSPTSTGKDLSVLSFLSSIRDRLKG